MKFLNLCLVLMISLVGVYGDSISEDFDEEGVTQSSGDSNVIYWEINGEEVDIEAELILDPLELTEPPIIDENSLVGEPIIESVDDIPSNDEIAQKISVEDKLEENSYQLELEINSTIISKEDLSHESVATEDVSKLELDSNSDATLLKLLLGVVSFLVVAVIGLFYLVLKKI